MNNFHYWEDETAEENICAMIDQGDAIFFQFRGRDYFIEYGNNGYLIQDPQIGPDGFSRDDIPYTDYPGHEEARTPEELCALPFLDGKTIFERWEELRFFDVGCTREMLEKIVEGFKKNDAETGIT